MEYDIEIHTRNSGEKIVSVGIGGRMVAMTAFEWLQLCEQVVTEINRHGQLKIKCPACKDTGSVGYPCPNCRPLNSAQLTPKS